VCEEVRGGEQRKRGRKIRQKRRKKKRKRVKSWDESEEGE
jgi:hypothetical protein